MSLWRQLEQQQMGGGSSSEPTIPAPTPPVTPNNSASLAVEQATFRQQLRRKSINSTNTQAGGAYMPAAGSAGATSTPGAK